MSYLLISLASSGCFPFHPGAVLAPSLSFWDYELLEGSDCIEFICVFQLPAQSTGQSGWMKNFYILCEIANYSHPWKEKQI